MVVVVRAFLLFLGSSQKREGGREAEVVSLRCLTAEGGIEGAWLAEQAERGAGSSRLMVEKVRSAAE